MLHILAMSTVPSRVLEPGQGQILEIEFDLDPGTPNGTVTLSFSDVFIVDVHGQLIPTVAQNGTFFDPQITLFNEISKAAGFDVLFNLPGQGAFASAWADYDLDGDEDLLYVGGSNIYTTLFRNNGDGTFTELGESSGIAAIAQGADWAAWGDYDNDGDPDAFLIRGGNGLLVENNGEGTFTDATAASGIDIQGGGTSVTWVDFNNDGYLDVHVGDGFLFKNNGDKTFRNVTQETGMNIITGVVWIDFDNDGDLEPINDESQLRNDDGVFTNITGTTGIVCCAGGFSSWGDYDNDQDFDLFITGSSALGSGVSVLYRNNGNSTFTDVTSPAGVAVAESRSAKWADFDNDADLDLFVTRPAMIDSPYVLFSNNGDGTFTNIASLANVVRGDWFPGHPGAQPGQGAAWSDFNNDGRLDLFVANETYPDFLFENRGNGTDNHFLVLTLVGTNSNKSAIGARVTVEANGITQIREVQGGANTSQNSLPVEFGLGQAQQVDKITIRWPSGLEESTTRAIAVDQFLTLEEGTLHTVDVAESYDSTIPTEFMLFQNYPNPFNPTTTIRFDVAKPAHVEMLLYDVLGRQVAVLVNKRFAAGRYQVIFNAVNVASGIYYYTTKIGEYQAVKKMLFLK
ncbi:MAG: FG-GAP-like repeat-containing protein [bacterium]